MNPMLLAALIQQIAVPELVTWLHQLHNQGVQLDDAAVIQKLATDTTLGQQIGRAWLAANPPTPGA